MITEMTAAPMTKIAEASGLAFGGAPFGGAVTGGAGVGVLVLMWFSPVFARMWQAFPRIFSFQGVRGPAAATECPNKLGM
jgi:hypothetical protein